MTYLDTPLQCASLTGDTLVFENSGSLRSAIAQGLFLLRVPESINLEPGIKLCREFYLPATDFTNYGGFRLQTDIYFDREHFQTEHLLVDKSRWATRRARCPVPGARCVGMAMLSTGQRWSRACLQPSICA